jgi:hypothetical protein
MNEVGQKIREHLEAVTTLIESNPDLSFRWLFVRVETADREAGFEKLESFYENLKEAGFEQTERTKRTQYEVEYPLLIKDGEGGRLAITLAHRPTENDRVRALREQKAKIEKELAELEVAHEHN